MKKRQGLIIIICLALVGAYLWWAHFNIYYQMGLAGLKAPSQTALNFMIKSQAKKITYAVLGDSLTAGVGVVNYQDSWPALVAQKLTTNDRGIILQNFSYPGYRAADLLKNLLPQAIAAKPDIVTVLIGVNDIHGEVGQLVFKQEYKNILEQLTQKTGAKIYAVSIPFIGSDTLLLPPYNFYFEKETAQYNKIIQDLAKTYGVRYIDIYTPTVAIFKKNGPHYSADNFHPSAAGYELWAKIIAHDINN